MAYCIFDETALQAGEKWVVISWRIINSALLQLGWILGRAGEWNCISPLLHFSISPQFEISCEMWSSRLHVWGGGQVQRQGRSSTSLLWWNFLCFSMVMVSQYCFLDILGPGTRNINHKLKFLHHACYGSVRIASGRTGPLTNGVCCGWC